MARLIRANSDTPTVTNNDDFRLFRYATGGYNGVVANFENECDYSVSGSDFTIESGEIVYQGVDTEILTSGETLTVDNISGTQYYVIYLEIDLGDSAAQTATLKMSYGTSTYPTISAGDDLTTNPNGLANFSLYHFTVTAGAISNVIKLFDIVEIGKVLSSATADYVSGANYDLVIRTQSEFNAMIASSTWLGAKSVALIGGVTAFFYSVTDNSGIKIPSAVTKIHGYNNATIVVTNFLYNASTAKGGLWYSTAPTDNSNEIRNITIDVTAAVSVGFTGCKNLINCEAITTGVGEAACFVGCTNLIDCTANANGGSTAHSILTGFKDCNNIVNCISVAGDYAVDSAYGFHDCNYLTNCNGTGSGQVLGAGFIDCQYLSNCLGKGESTTEGYGFYSITRASCCSDNGSTTNMWSGLNYSIDSSAHKTPVIVSNSTLNT